MGIKDEIPNDKIFTKINSSVSVFDLRTEMHLEDKKINRGERTTESYCFRFVF